MSTILVVTSSPLQDSVSRKLALELAAGIAARSGGGIVVRDVGAEPPAHMDAALASAIRKQPSERSPEEAAAAQRSDALVDELLAADVVILATGLANFGIYSGLKSWIDNVARAGRTFRYSSSGPEGLVPARRAYVVLASGGRYSSGAGSAADHAAPYLRTVMGFLGIEDVRVIRAEGLALGPEATLEAIETARRLIEVEKTA